MRTEYGVRSEMLRNASHAYHQRPDHSVDIRPCSGARSILDAFSMAAERRRESAQITISEAHRRREAQSLSFDDDQASSRGPTKRMKKLIDPRIRGPE